MADFLSGPSKPAGKRAPALKDIELALRDAETRVTSGEWSDATARTLVGFYAWCHRSVYGVAPLELENAAEFRAAGRAALRMLHERFKDDAPEAALFIRWAWKREKGRVAWCAAKKIEGRKRMGWRFQFSDSLFADYTIAVLERAARGR